MKKTANNGSDEPKPWGSNGPAGSWEIEKAKTPDGSSYEGGVVIASEGNIWLCSWETTIGKFRGTGVLHNGQLLVARDSAESEESDRPGIVWYSLCEKGELDGVWNIGALGGLLGTGRATAPTKGEPCSIAGKRAIRYFNALGNASPPLGSPPLELEITSVGKEDVFDMTWSENGKKVYEGVGMPTELALGSAWRPVPKAYNAGLALLIFDATPPDQPCGGTWARTAALGSEARGCERIVRA